MKTPKLPEYSIDILKENSKVSIWNLLLLWIYKETLSKLGDKISIFYRPAQENSKATKIFY